MNPDEPAFTGQDVDELLADRAATHLIASSDEQGALTYRLHHQALADHFAPPASAATGHARIVNRLQRSLLDVNGVPSWSAPARYLLRALPGHAAAAGVLVSVATDPEALLHIDCDRLYAELRLQREPELIAIRSLLSPLLHRLRTLSRAHRAVLLAVAARATLSSSGLTTGLVAIAADRAKVRVMAAAIRSASRSLTLLDRSMSQSALLAGTTNSAGESLLVVTDGSLVEVWSPDDVVRLTALEDHNAEVGDIQAFSDRDGIPALVTIDDAGVVYVRDLELSGGPRFTAIVDGSRPSVAVGRSSVGEAFVVALTTTGCTIVYPDGDREPWRLANPPGVVAFTSVAVVGRARGGDLLALGYPDRVDIWDPEFASTVVGFDLPGCLSPSMASGCRPGSDGILLILDPIGGGFWCWSPAGDLESLDESWHPTTAAVHATPEGRWAVIGSLNGEVRLLDLDARRVVRELKRAAATINAIDILGERGEQPAVAAALDQFGEINVWQLNTAEWLITHRVPDEVRDLALGRYGDGEPYVATMGPGGVRLWEVVPEALQVAHELHGGVITDLALIGEGADVLVTTLGSEGSIRVWDGRSSELIVVRSCPPDHASQIAVRQDPSGLVAAFGGDDGLFDIGLTAVSAQVLRVGPVRVLAQLELPDGRTAIAIALAQNVQIRVAATGEPLVDFDLVDSAVHSLAVSVLPDGTVLVAAGCADGIVQLWRWDPATGASAQRVIPDLRGVVSWLSFLDPPGQVGIVAGCRGGIVRHVDLDLNVDEVGFALTSRHLAGPLDGLLTGLLAVGGTVVAGLTRPDGNSVLRWRTDSWASAEIRSLPSPVRSLAGPCLIDGTTWIAGGVEGGVVLVPAVDELHCRVIDLPITPDLVRVRGDQVFVAGAGGFLSFAVLPAAAGTN